MFIKKSSYSEKVQHTQAKKWMEEPNLLLPNLSPFDTPKSLNSRMYLSSLFSVILGTAYPFGTLQYLLWTEERFAHVRLSPIDLPISSDLVFVNKLVKLFAIYQIKIFEIFKWGWNFYIASIILLTLPL